MPLRLLFLRRLGIGIALVVKDLVKVCFGSSEGRLRRPEDLVQDAEAVLSQLGAEDDV